MDGLGSVGFAAETSLGLPGLESSPSVKLTALTSAPSRATLHLGVHVGIYFYNQLEHRVYLCDTILTRKRKFDKRDENRIDREDNDDIEAPADEMSTEKESRRKNY